MFGWFDTVDHRLEIFLLLSITSSFNHEIICPFNGTMTKNVHPIHLQSYPIFSVLLLSTKAILVVKNIRLPLCDVLNMFPSSSSQLLLISISLEVLNSVLTFATQNRWHSICRAWGIKNLSSCITIWQSRHSLHPFLIQHPSPAVSHRLSWPQLNHSAMAEFKLKGLELSSNSYSVSLI